jgi:hypothetical protein
MHLA